MSRGRRLDADPSRASDLERIGSALRAAARAVERFTPGAVAWREKDEGDGRWNPVTEADRALDALLRRRLPRPGDGWLSEESADDARRLGCSRVWVVDPLDGTREFVEGVPEWCISVGLVEEGRAVAGGVLNPATGQLILGAEEEGVTVDGEQAVPERKRELAGAVVLASRSEVARGEWERYRDAPFEVRPCGSVAFKLGLVGAGLADATWTLVPKNEWDVAAGAALVRASGGAVLHRDGSFPSFNRPDPRLPDLLAGEPELLEELLAEWI